MSLVPIGCASDRVTMYEENTPVVSITTLSGLSADPLPPDGTLEYQLIAANTFRTNGPTLDILMDVTVDYDVTCPPGEIDNSTFACRISGNLSNSANYSKDVLSSAFGGVSSGITNVLTVTVGLLKIDYNQPVEIRILRQGGNPLVSVSVAQVYSKYKRLD